MRAFGWACVVVSSVVAAVGVVLAFGLGREYGIDEAAIVLVVTAPIAGIPGLVGYTLLHREDKGAARRGDLDPLLVAGLACTGGGVLILMSAAGGGVAVGLVVAGAGILMSWAGFTRMRHRPHS